MNERKKRMTKKALKEYYKSQRAVNGFNTGTRDMKSEKYPTRARQKELNRKEIAGMGQETHSQLIVSPGAATACYFIIF